MRLFCLFDECGYFRPVRRVFGRLKSAVLCSGTTGILRAKSIAEPNEARRAVAAEKIDRLIMFTSPLNFTFNEQYCTI
ncbi:hypothetical protein L905_18990 [Agrobacterium sp. TS43]|nr:hypothetical protein K538_06950 [Agrobacterium tumefaciens GW4]KVK49479.1 hypothetical protein L903_19345 [Agrobacterium sp. JL28]KVK49715.1 hypothetical protein L904_19330 [Agrobacterium sp. LY4]KVK62658.1 hypothetical protein L906_18465 [Agrobacterium sp. TS45]KVK65043.1 hypothetical protein L905_18990 [Agrobacterium sp. TS43]KVK67108.1 hypothetical protein L907_18440 [Agrobacterium sp. C13]